MADTKRVWVFCPTIIIENRKKYGPLVCKPRHIIRNFIVLHSDWLLNLSTDKNLHRLTCMFSNAVGLLCCVEMCLTSINCMAHYDIITSKNMWNFVLSLHVFCVCYGPIINLRLHGTDTHPWGKRSVLSSKVNPFSAYRTSYDAIGKMLSIWL